MSKNRNKQSKQPHLTDGFAVNPFSHMEIDVPHLTSDNTGGKTDNTNSEGELRQNPTNNRNLNRLTIRIEEKGRRGKKVTIIEGFQGMTSNKISDLCRKLKQSLGIGGTVINNTIELQGKNHEKIEEQLQKNGFVFK